MRLYISVTPNSETVPFNYQPCLVGAIHKWLGKNDIHNTLSLYSLSWLTHGKIMNQGLDFPRGSRFFVSSPIPEILKHIIRGIQDDPYIRFGMYAKELCIQSSPNFGPMHRFVVQSPILIKRNINGSIRFFFPDDSESDQLLTETLAHKLEKLGKDSSKVNVSFDRSYTGIRTKMTCYKGIYNKGTLCPVIVTGSPEAVASAWDLGIGNSTGIGFGALK